MTYVFYKPKLPIFAEIVMFKPIGNRELQLVAKVQNFSEFRNKYTKHIDGEPELISLNNWLKDQLDH